MKPEVLVLTKLFLAHLLGDFVLQPSVWVKDKEQRIWRSPYLYAHIVIHIILTFLAFGSLDYWKYVLLIGLSHYGIDVIKLIFCKRAPRFWFIADQALHLFVLIAVWTWAYNASIAIHPHAWIYITAYIFVIFPASTFIRIFFTKWNITPVTQELSGLKNAGHWIGLIERLLILTFILVDKWEAVGFLLAAKSIFRFGDLKESREINLTEYILIGTLLSFSIAILTGIVVVQLTH